MKLRQKLESVLCDPEGNPVIGSCGDRQIIKECLDEIERLKSPEEIYQDKVKLNYALGVIKQFKKADDSKCLFEFCKIRDELKEFEEKFGKI